MSKSLRSIKSKDEKIATIVRRLKSNTKGLGYWAAVDAAKYFGIKAERNETNH